jgi:hypothetical protein
VDAEYPFRMESGEPCGHTSADVTGAGYEPWVAERGHELDPALGCPSRCVVHEADWGSRERKAWQSGHHDVKALSRGRPILGRARETVDDSEQLKDRAGPAVGQHDRQASSRSPRK